MSLDLNLLTALDALLEEGGVGAAAERMHLSEPAMSRTLGRIRQVTGDQILVRTGRSMTPTPYALAIQGDVHRLVQEARAVLAPEHALNLSTLERTFTLRGHDAIITALGPALLAAVQRLAPGVRLRFLAETATDTLELRSGQVDLEIGSSSAVLPELRSESIGAGTLVVALRPGHPLAEGHLSAARYAQAQHLSVSRRGRLHDPLDDALAALGLRRRVVASVPTTTAALSIVAQSDLLAVVPEVMCRTVLRSLGLCIRPLPLEVQPIPIIQTWHARYDHDKAHAWFRELVRQSVEVSRDE